MFISKRKHERELQKLRLDAAISDARLVSMVARMQNAERVALEAVRIARRWRSAYIRKTLDRVRQHNFDDGEPQ